MFGIFSGGKVVKDRRDERAAHEKDRETAFIERLRNEHHEILALCEELELALVKGKGGRLSERFALLEGMIRRHRMDEDGKLLLYIDKRFGADHEVSSKVAEIRKQRDRLRRRLVAFADKLECLEVSVDITLAELQVDLERIGANLVHLIEDEERYLFPLYGQSPARYPLSGDLEAATAS